MSVFFEKQKIIIVWINQLISWENFNIVKFSKILRDFKQNFYIENWKPYYSN